MELLEVRPELVGLVFKPLVDGKDVTKKIVEGEPKKKMGDF